MRDIRVRLASVGMALSLTLASAAFAVPKYYEIAGGNVNGHFNDPGLVINTSLAGGLPGTSFTLNDGGSNTFNFFSIWTNETAINSDDLVSYAITATLNFSDPLTGATVNGVTFGGSILFGLTQWGQIQWNGPTTVTLGDRVFSLSLSNETFNSGIFGLNEGPQCGAIVEATVTQLSSTVSNPNGAPVPEHGNTGLLLGAAVTGLAVFSRRRILG
ncbi:MAG TPA: hypothetical protein VFQ78_08925 [Candidatus Udaeobacter sp.]|nr:hypothetical protein [Candidatus Udaeobacter sp.]